MDISEKICDHAGASFPMYNEKDLHPAMAMLT